MEDLEKFKPQYMLPNERCRNPKDLVDQIDILNKQIIELKKHRKDKNIINGLDLKARENMISIWTVKHKLRCHHLALGLMRGRKWNEIDWVLGKEKIFMQDYVIRSTLIILENCYIPVRQSIGMFISSLI